MHAQQNRILCLALVLSMLLSFVTGPTTAAQAARSQTRLAGPSSPAAAFTPGNLVVYRVGTINNPTPLSTAASPVFLDEYTPSGVLVQSIAMPTADSNGHKALVASGQTTSEGLLTRSTDGHYLLLTGYAAAPGTPSIASTSATTVNRVIGRVDSDGTIDTTTALSDFASGLNPRSAASTNGTDFWAGGGSGGLRYTTLGSTTSVQVSSTPANLRQVHIFDNQLFISAGSGSIRIARVGTGLPQEPGQIATNLPGLPTTTGSPYGFFFADLDPGIAGMDTLYVADESTGGGIQKYSLVYGSWTLNNSTAAGYYRGLTGLANDTAVLLFAVRGGNELVLLEDSAGYNAALSSTTPTLLATAATNTGFRGVAFAPVPGSDVAPTVAGTTPPDGATGVAVGTNITIQFTEAVFIADGAFTLTCEGTVQPFTVSGSGTDTITLDPDIDLPYAGTCRITVTAGLVNDIDGTPTPMKADYNWSFSTPVDDPPAITSVMPVDSAADVPVNSNIVVTFSEAVNVVQDAFAITCNSAAHSFTIDGSGKDTITIDPNGDLPYTKTCTVTINASLVNDIDGIPTPMAANHSWSFSTPADHPPAISSTVPVEGAVGVAVSNDIKITFSEAVNAIKDAFTIMCGGVAHSFTLSGSGASYTLDPSSDLPYTKKCTVSVDGALITDQDYLPNPMAADYNWSFDTVVDNPPIVSSITPVDGADNVALNTNIAITFSEPVDANKPAFSLTCSGTSRSFTLSGSGSQYTLNPDANLPGAALCTLFITAVMVTDQDGNPDAMPADFTASFTTTGDLPPTVSSTLPPEGATGIGVDTLITVNFSESVTLANGAFDVSCESGVQVFTVSANSASSYNLIPAAALPYGETCTVFVEADKVTDQDGLSDPMEVDYAWSFKTVSDHAPTVVSTLPANGTSGVAVDSSITLHFSEAVTAPRAAFALSCEGSGREANPDFSVSGSGTAVITLQPASSLPYGMTCTVRVTAASITDLDGVATLMTQDYSWNFSTPADNPPMVSGVSPLNNAVNVPVNSSIRVQFTETVSVSNGAFALTCGGSTLPYTLSGSGTDTITLHPDGDLPYTKTCTATISADLVMDIDGDPTPMTADYIWSFSTPVDHPPAVSGTAPVDGAMNVGVTTDIEITFNEGVNAVKEAFIITCGGSVQPFSLNGSGTSYTLDPITDLPYNQRCTVTINAALVIDQDYLPTPLVADYSWSFYTPVDELPVVTSTAPANGAVDVPVNGDIQITFSEAVNVVKEAFDITCGNAVQSFALSGSGASYTLNPTTDLPYTQRCTVTILGTLVSDQDYLPNSMAVNYSWSFSTPVDDPPAVTSTTPVNTAVNVAVNSDIHVTFSEPVDVIQGAFTIACNGVAQLFEISGSGVSYTLNPTNDLPYTRHCTVSVDGALITDRDYLPNPMAANYSWSFDTIVDNPPTVSSTNPVDGATDVALNTDISIIFSEAVNTTQSAFTLTCAGAVRSFAFSGSGTQYILNPDASLPGAALCTLSITAALVTDQDGIADAMPANVTGSFTTTGDLPPTVSSTLPAKDATGVPVSTPITVNFSENVSVAGDAFTLSCDSGLQTFTVSANSPSSYRLTPVIPLPYGETCTVTVEADKITDQDGAIDLMETDYIWSFRTVADNAPTIVSTLPGSGASGVAVNSSITINFSEAVTAPKAAFILTCQGANQDFTVLGSGTAVITLAPMSSLPYSGTCSVSVTASNITDLDGAPTPMAQDYTWSFSTPVDNPPTVNSVSPPHNAANVAVNSHIIVNFNEPVTASASAFSVTCGGQTHAFTRSGSGSTTITLAPIAALPYSKTCTVTVKAVQVTDLDGRPDTLAADYVWSFSTTYDPAGPTPVAVARAAGPGWSGTLRGNVTVLPGTYRGDVFAIQDATGGIYVYTSLVLPSMSLGDVMTVTGSIPALYRGLMEIVPTSLGRVGSGIMLAPQVIATGAAAPTQGLLVSVTGVVALGGKVPPAPGGADFTFNLDDGSGPVQVFVDKDTHIDMSGLIEGETIRVIGFSGSYNAPQVMPRRQSDFIIDLTAPKITGTAPVNDATGVSPFTQVKATFDKAIDSATLSSASFNLAESGGSSISGLVTYDADSHTAVFTPAVPLATTRTYIATLTTAIKATNGMPLTATYRWSFTTAVPDVTAPAVTGKAPAPGATEVPLGAQVKVTFSEAIEGSLVNAAHFILRSPYSQVPAALSYDPASYAVTLAPTDNLLPTQRYTMTVKADVADLSGNRLGSDAAWSFTTQAEPPMQVYFGDLHNHTSYSDGAGTPSEALAAGKAAGFDFMAISDHSYAISDSEWQATLEAVEHATGQDFVALRGFEYTQGAEGHINVWNTRRHAVRTPLPGCTYCDYTPSLEPGTAVQGFYPWLAITGTHALDAAGTVMQFNHPAWLNFNDWAYHPEVAGVARLVEAGSGSGPAYVFSEDEYLRALDYGWKLGAASNADTHTRAWGANTPHRTGVLMPGLTKAALLEALRLRRTFATEDQNFAITMQANGAWMGAEIDNSGQLQFAIAGADPDGELAARVELVTDQGRVAAAYTPAAADFTWSPLLSVTPGVHFFYVRVTQADGDRIVTSPVWTRAAEDIALTDIVVQPTLPTTYSPSLLTVRVTNRAAQSRTVQVTLKVDGVGLGPVVQVTAPANGDGYAVFHWRPAAAGPVTLTAQLLAAPAGDNPDDNASTLTLSVSDQPLPLILVDAGHANLNALGREMRAFVDDLSAHRFNVLKNLDALTPADLDPTVVKLLIITAPETAYTTQELAAIGSFVKAGGSLWLLGLADYPGKQPWAATVADRENAILAAVEAATGQPVNMRMNDDEVLDGDDHNGYPWGIVWHSFPAAAETGIGMNVQRLGSWSQSSLVDRNKQALTTGDGVHIVVAGDLDSGTGLYGYPNRTSNEDSDKASDAFLYPDGQVLPMAAVVDLPGTPGRIMLYGDSSDPFTTFAYTAGDGRQNELFNLQAVMYLIGQPLQKSTVAEARAQAIEDRPDHIGQLMWVEGEITAAYGEFFNVLYIQDETGGITVHAPAGDIDPAQYTRGARVRVIGPVDIDNGDTEIQFFEAEMVQVLSPGTGEVAPSVFGPSEAALEANQGWLARVTGTVTAKSGNDTLVIDGGSGSLRVFLDGYNGQFGDLAVGSPVQVTGLLSEDEHGGRLRVRNYKAHPAYADDVIVLQTTLALSKTVSQAGAVRPGSQVTYTLTLQNTGVQKAVGIALNDTLPAGITFQDFATASGATYQGGVVSWRGDLPAGSAVTIVFTVTTSQEAGVYGQTVSNTALFTAGNAPSSSSSAAFTFKALQKLYLPSVSRP